MTQDAAVIDADGHVLEPAEAWRHLDPSIRPRIETDARGLDHVRADVRVRAADR